MIKLYHILFMKCTHKTKLSSGFDFADMICCKEFVYM